MKSKKGGMIAEAAVVFPVVITVVLAIVYILITLYIDAATDARDHLALRGEAGTYTKTVDRKDESKNLIPEDKFGRRPFRQTPDIISGWKLPDRILFTDKDSVYITDEADYIRKMDLLKNVSDEI